jgi:SNF2 family DNA or RNA helicase
VPHAELSDDGSIRVETAYTDRDRMLLIPGSTYRGKDGNWRLPLSWASCVVLRGVFGAELTLGPGLVGWAEKERKRVERALELREALELPPSAARGAALIDKVEAESGTGFRLKPFQRVDVAFLVTMETAGIFQPMGAGKSAVAIRTLQVLKAAGRQPFPAVIVAPNSVKATVWPGELERWAPELSYAVVDGGAAARRKQIFKRADVTVINWENVRLHSRVAGYGDIRLTDKDKLLKELNELEPRTVILDEAHRCRNPKSAQSRAVKWLAHQARYRFALTGTPVDNHPGELWGILHVVAPDWHPGHTRYTDRWVLTGYSLYGGLTVLGLNPATEPEFRKVTLPLYRRLPKEVILPQLPEKLPVQTRLTPMTPKQSRIYHEMEQNQLAQLDDLLVAGDSRTAMMRLMQFAAAYADHVEVAVDEKTGKPHYSITLSEPSCKVDDLMELLDELDDEPLVVVAVSRQLVELAAARLSGDGIPYALVTGAQSGDERAEAVRWFQAGDVRVILLTLGAGAEGLTLTRARILLFMQEDWSPSVNAQAEDRIHRIGSEIHGNRGVQIIKQITPGTVEERKPLALAAKQGRIEEIFQDKDALKRLLGG